MWLLDYFLPIYGPNNLSTLYLADRLTKLPPGLAQAIKSPLTIWEVATAS